MKRATLFTLSAALAFGGLAVGSEKPRESYLEVTTDGSSVLIEFAAMAQGQALETRAEETPFVVQVGAPTVGGWLFQNKSGSGDITVRYVSVINGESADGLSGTGKNLVFTLYQDEPRIFVYSGPPNNPLKPSAD